jgi:hypothetical protein
LCFQESVGKHYFIWDGYGYHDVRAAYSFIQITHILHFCECLLEVVNEFLLGKSFEFVKDLCHTRLCCLHGLSLCVITYNEHELVWMSRYFGRLTIAKQSIRFCNKGVTLEVLTEFRGWLWRFGKTLLLWWCTGWKEGVRIFPFAWEKTTNKLLL